MKDTAGNFETRKLPLSAGKGHRMPVLDLFQVVLPQRRVSKEGAHQVREFQLAEHAQLACPEARHDLGKRQLQHICELLKLFPGRHKVVDRVLNIHNYACQRCTSPQKMLPSAYIDAPPTSSL